MTRDRLMQIAAHHALTLALEMVTTGHPDGAAFREFEFTGPSRACLGRATEAIRKEWNVPRSTSKDFCAVHPSQIDARPSLLVSSFYCGPASASAAAAPATPTA